MKSKIIFVLVFVLIIAGVGIGWYLNVHSGKKKETKPLSVPQPVEVQQVPQVSQVVTLKTIRGEVVRISANRFDLRPDFVTDTALEKLPKQYQVNMSADTQITRASIVIPYLTRPTEPAEDTTSSKEQLHTGMNISMTTASDITQSTVEAKSITLPRITYLLDATILEINGKTMTVDAIPILEVLPNPNSPGYKSVTHETWTVNVTDGTEIAHQSEKGIQRYRIDDLQKDRRVMIYTTTDVTETKTVQAAKIEPVE